MNQFVIDTHALVWYFSADSRLSARAKRCIDTGAGIVSTIVLLECLSLSEKKKVPVSFWEVLFSIASMRNFRIVSLDLPTLLQVDKIHGSRDLHDRAIMATAKLFDAELISKDGVIKKLYPKTIW